MSLLTKLENNNYRFQSNWKSNFTVIHKCLGFSVLFQKRIIFYLLVKDNFSRNRRKIAHRMEYFQMACVNFKNGRRFENYPFLRLTFKSRFWYLITPFGVKSIVNCHLYKPAFEGFGCQQLITNKCAVYSPPTMIYRAFNFYDSAKWLATLQASRENSSWLM